MDYYSTLPDKEEQKRIMEEAERIAKTPPCMECGAMTKDEAASMCKCGGDKDSCHGVTIWTD